MMHKMDGYNPLQCSFASTLSGCIERDTSKLIIDLRMINGMVEIFEKSLIGAFGQDLKVGYILQLNIEKTFINRRRISKILKLNENDQ